MSEAICGTFPGIASLTRATRGVETVAPHDVFGITVDDAEAAGSASR
jgi:hypothetical protein